MASMGSNYKEKEKEFAVKLRQNQQMPSFCGCKR